MSVEEPVSAHIEGRVTPIRAAPSPSLDPGELAERAFRTALGLASLAAGFVTAVVAEAIRGEIREPADDAHGDEPLPRSFVPVLAGAAFGVAMQFAQAGGRAAATVGRSLNPWISFLTSPSFVRERLEGIRQLVDDLDDRWRAEQLEDERVGSAFVRAVVPRVVDATLEQLDLTELILSRVDLDGVVGAVDLERVVSRIDLDAIVARVDPERIVAKIDVDRIVDRVDVGRIVDRVDLDAVAARIDIEAIVHRLDLAAIALEVIDQLDLASIARGVIDEIDLPQIVRESTGTMANETVEGIRAQSMSADRAVSRFVDRVLGRDRGVGDPGAGD